MTDIDTDRLERSLNQMIRKHKTLQSIVTDDAKVRAAEYSDYRIARHDLSELTEEKREAELSGIRDRLRNMTYPFNKWPWFTVEYSDLGEGRGILHIEIELSLFDIWSIRIFLEEWYAAYKSGETSEAPGITYGQYTAYLRDRRTSSQFESDRRYWENRLSEFTDPPHLPTEDTGKGFHKTFGHMSYELSK